MQKPRGGRGDTCDHGFSRRSWKVNVCKKKKEEKKGRCLPYFPGTFFYPLFTPSIIIALPSPSLPVVTQIRGRTVAYRSIAGPPPPSPLTSYRSCFQFCREKNSVSSSHLFPLLCTLLVEFYLTDQHIHTYSYTHSFLCRIGSAFIPAVHGFHARSSIFIKFWNLANNV